MNILQTTEPRLFNTFVNLSVCGLGYVKLEKTKGLF